MAQAANFVIYVGPYSLVLRNLKAFAITETELKLIAKAAIMGLSSRPAKG